MTSEGSLYMVGTHYLTVEKRAKRMPDTTIETTPFNYNYRWGLNNGYACLLSELWSLRTCKRLGDWNFSIPKKSINNWHQQHSGARYSDLACVILNLFVKLSYEWFQNESMNDPNLSVWGPISRPKDFQLTPNFVQVMSDTKRWGFTICHIKLVLNQDWDCW